MKTRKNGWVARACAEAAISDETFSLTLTYNNETQENRDGSQMFRYRDIKQFLRRLRRAIEWHYGTTGAVRFICCGEYGSDRGRVHWHILLFCNVDILALGEMRCFRTKKPVTERDDKITTGKVKNRLLWSLWPHGLMTFQKPDQGGIAYAMQYVGKDQFNTTASKGTMRQSKVENYSAGYFRMSKAPPIGQPWLMKKIGRLIAARAVLPDTKLKVPGYSGYWYPSGTLRILLLRAFYVINDICIAETGRPAPQMRSLLHRLADNQTDWEVLTYGEESPEDVIDEEDFALEIALRGKETRQRQADSATRDRCGSFLPCRACARGLGDIEFSRLRAAYEAAIETHGSGQAVERAHKKTGIPSPYCKQREQYYVRRAFPNSNA